MTLGDFFAGLAVFSLALIAIACAIERGARLKDQKDQPRDETLGVDQHTEQRRAALPFQKVAAKGWDSRQPFVSAQQAAKDRDGQRRRELMASVDFPDRKIH
jgi:hypothetical protein